MNKAKVTLKFLGAQVWRNGADCATKYRIDSFERSLAPTRCDKCWLLLFKHQILSLFNESLKVLVLFLFLCCCWEEGYRILQIKSQMLHPPPSHFS